MKTIQHLLLVLAILSINIFGAQAQYFGDMPSAGFGSTSSSAFYSGSSFQSAAVSGYMSADDYYNNSMSYSSPVRRGIGGGDEEEWGEGGGEHLPDVNTPIGEGLYILLLLAAIAAWRVSRRRKIAAIEE